MLLSFLVCLSSITVAPIVQGSVPQEGGTKKACDTTECNYYAQKISNSMNTTMDPCDDFYAYACGSWHLHNPIPDDRTHWSLFAQMTRMTNRRLRDVISEPEDPNSPPAVIKVQRFYKSCMDTERLEKRGIEPLANILNRKGGWPIAMRKERWNPKEKSWLDVDVSYFKITGHMAIMKIMYTPDNEDSSKFVITINMDRKFPFDIVHKQLDSQSIYNKYINIITETAAIFARDDRDVLAEQILQDAAKIVQLEQLLQLITKLDDGSSRTKMSIGEFQEMFNNFGGYTEENQIDWLRAIKKIFKQVKDVTITTETQVYISCQSCLSYLANIFLLADKRALVNYVHWVFLSNHVQYGNRQLRDIRHRTIYMNYDSVTRKPRWEECILDLPLKHGMGIMLAHKYAQSAEIRRAVDMTNRIRDNMMKDVVQIEWANDNMKQYIIDKLDHLEEQIGYPEWYSDEVAVQKLYENFVVGANYFKNIIYYNKYETTRQLQFLTTGLPKEEWIEYPISVNAFYNVPKNTMLLTAAQIQGLYFDENMPNAVSYGFLGFIVGHEIGHGLDIYGIRFDKDGNRLQDDLQEWLDDYDLRAQCFARQYSSYILDELDQDGNPRYLDGNLTQRDNIADAIGIKVSYNAFKLMQQSDTITPGTLKDLPNIDADQLFFLSFATGWCGNDRRGSVVIDQSDGHSPYNIRINGALSNSEDFAKAFQCQSGSKMNPEEKCSVWN